MKRQTDRRPHGTLQEINIVLLLLGVRHAMQEPIQARPCRIDE